MSDVPELRHAALVRAGAMRDGRVSEVLRRAMIEASERAGGAWESSDGTVRALDVRVLVDGYAIGLCDAFPSVRDAVIAAISAEAPVVLGATVVDIAITWGIRERPIAEGYRDRGDVVERVDRASPEDLRRALIGWFTAMGDEPTARAYADGTIRQDEDDPAAWSLHPAGAVESGKLEGALAALAGNG